MQLEFECSEGVVISRADISGGFLGEAVCGIAKLDVSLR